MNLCNSYTLGPKLRNLNTYFTLGNCLFGSAKLTKNVHLDKYKYSGYSIGFDSRSEFSLPDSALGQNVIIFGADMSSSVHVVNKGKDILILDERPTQGLDDTINSRSKISYQFYTIRKEICTLSLLKSTL